MPISNLSALCFAMGHQGGTISQVARDLDVKTSDILEADENRMEDLLRLAQAYSRKKQGINQTHITIGYFVYTASDMSETQVYESYEDMFNDWPGKDRIMVREIVNHIAADNIYITPCYIVNKIVDDVSDDYGVSFRYEAQK